MKKIIEQDICARCVHLEPRAPLPTGQFEVEAECAQDWPYTTVMASANAISECPQFQQPSLAMEARPGTADSAPCEERAAPVVSSLSNEQTPRGGSIARGDESERSSTDSVKDATELLRRVDTALRAAWDARTLPASVIPAELAQAIDAHLNGVQNTGGTSK